MPWRRRISATASCADADPHRSPILIDIPEDGVDNDCDGSDALLADLNVVYVEGESGNDSAAGTVGEPLATVTAGIAMAEAAPVPTVVPFALIDDNVVQITETYPGQGIYLEGEGVIRGNVVHTVGARAIEVRGLGARVDIINNALRADTGEVLFVRPTERLVVVNNTMIGEGTLVQYHLSGHDENYFVNNAMQHNGREVVRRSLRLGTFSTTTTAMGRCSSLVLAPAEPIL